MILVSNTNKENKKVINILELSRSYNIYSLDLILYEYSREKKKKVSNNSI